MLVAGIDSSTQSIKIVLCRAEDGEVLAQASSPHRTEPSAIRGSGGSGRVAD
jgi:sugar (pentulose or hexulose) kinase